MKFKIRLSQLSSKILIEQGSLNQIRHCLTGHNQIWHHFLSKKYFNDFENQNFSVLWWNEIKSDIFSWYILKSDAISFLWENIKVSQVYD